MVDFLHSLIFPHIFHPLLQDHEFLLCKSPLCCSLATYMTFKGPNRW
jgi:hypothetical protein